MERILNKFPGRTNLNRVARTHKLHSKHSFELFLKNLNVTELNLKDKCETFF